MKDRRTATQRDYEQRILRVLVHIQRHLDEPLDLTSLAERAHFSPFHFHRVFRGLVGEPLREHVRRLRLERAAQHLRSGSRSVTAIALDAGYATPESFTRSFRSRFACSPSAYRQARGATRADQPGADDRAKPTDAPTLFLRGAAMQARIESLAPLTVAFVRHVGPYEQVGAAWGRLCAWAGPRGLLGPQTRMFGMSHDDPEVTPADKLRYDACIVVGDDVRAEADVGVQTLAGGRYAVTTHAGAYSGFAEAYAELMGRWMPAHDLQPAAGEACLEFYANDPDTTPEADLRTDIWVPLMQTAGAPGAD